MTEKAYLSTAMDQVMPDIDRYLAGLDIPLALRPLEAAKIFVEDFVISVQDRGGPAAAPGKPQDYLLTRWFAMLYGEVDEWYRDNFPGAMLQERDDSIFGVVMIAGTAFAIRVPIVRRRAGRPGETVWISFPDGLREGERPLDWIEAAPNFGKLSPRERQDAEEFAAEVAGALRFIRTGLMAVSTGDEKLDGFKAGVMPRLRNAAQLLLEPNPAPVQQAYWELQLACETALKALLQQRTGSFKETHDLFNLFDVVPAPAPAFSRDLLKRVPSWKETIDLRYGQGQRESRADCIKCYRAVLAIIVGTVRSMEKMGIGEAEFEIGRPPWLEFRQ